MRLGTRHAWTIEQLRDALARRRASADFSSLFRALERMVGEQTLDKITVGNAPAYYEPHGAHHDHLYCTRCGKLVAVPCLAARLDVAELGQKVGFALAAHEIIISGVCKDCQHSPSKHAARQ